ncbi:MAG TPA: type VII secretion integral membrane protein EccD [Pseudonocardiaceae bacterium]|nr:type VII secretion integral membrane protein EccD [Pseudonocardiaceae bacterium]
MTVVAPRTRIDVALPSDVAVADLLPMVLRMAGESTPDGGSRHGGWCLAKLGGNAIEPGQTLASLGVVDGDLLQLRRRSENPPPPLFDDVVEAVAAAAPGSYRPWTERTARTLGMVAGGLALLAGAVALLLSGPGLSVAGLAGAGALAALAVGTVIARVYGDTGIGVLVATASPVLGLVSGLYVVPSAGVPGTGGLVTALLALGAANLLLGCTLALVLATASIMLVGSGITPSVAIATAAALGALAGLTGTLVEHPAAGIAAGTAAVALGTISILPRLTIPLARLPLPQVPGSAEELQEDTSFPDYAVIERRAGLAHELMTGMIIGSSGVAAIAAVWATGSAENAFGPVLGAVVAAVLLLRARSYANSNQAIALLISGMAATAGLLGIWMMTASPLTRLVLVFCSLLVLAALALVLGVIVPRRRFSPVLRRSVDVAEAILIAAVLPLALGVMDLYNTFRAL